MAHWTHRLNRIIALSKTRELSSAEKRQYRKLYWGRTAGREWRGFGHQRRQLHEESGERIKMIAPDALNQVIMAGMVRDRRAQAELGQIADGGSDA